MGEAACLARSFSQPAEISSFETDEAVSLRGLTESVSFGRFKSESLAWEKYSAFSQNRYLEEVERFTKPGSVAEKRAFFEAHFKKRAAGRATHTKIEKRNVTTTNDETVRESLKDILIDSEMPVVVNTRVAMDEEVSNAEMDSVGPSISMMDETTEAQTEEMKVITVDNSMAVPEGEALNEGNYTSSSRERRLSSSESKACRRSSKLALSFVEELELSLKKTRKEPASSSKRPNSVSKKQNRLPSEPFQRSIKRAPSATTDKVNVGMPKNSPRRSTSGKGADKEKTAGPSSARKTTKRAPKPLARRNSIAQTSSNNVNSAFVKGNEPMGASKGRKRPLPRTTKEDSDSVKYSTRASVARLSKLPFNNRLSENERKNATVGSSVPCRIPNNVKNQPSSGCEKLPTHSRTRTRSITVSSPFNFRSDERAEKRKEYFKKLEEKNKNEEAGKEQRKNPQVGAFQVQLVSPSSPRLRSNKTPGLINRKKSQQAPLKSCKIHPSCKKTKKTSQENQSPNIS